MRTELISRAVIVPALVTGAVILPKPCKVPVAVLTTILHVSAQSLRAREAEARRDHVWIFEARTLSTASPATMRDVRCRDRMEPSCREPRIQTHGGPDQEKLSGLAPRAARLGSRSYLPDQPSQIGGSRIERGQSAGGYSDHPLIRLA